MAIFTDWPEFRSFFPSLDSRLYLNTAGGGAMSRQAAEAGIRYFTEARERADTAWESWLARADDSRQLVAHFIGATPEDVAFVQSTSLAFNLLARQFKRSCSVLAVDREFPSCTTPWLAAGHRVSFFAPHGDGSITPDIVDRAIGPDTDILVLSSVQFVDGFRADVAAIGALCQDRGVLFVVDATQSICAYDIHMRRDGIDALIFSGYKWATAGYGNAVLAVREAVRRPGEAPGSAAGLVGWRSAAIPYALENDRVELTPSAIRYEMGHPPFSAIFTLSAAVELFMEQGMEGVSSRVSALSRRLRSELKRGGRRLATDTEDRLGPDSISGITHVLVPDAASVAGALSERNVWVSARGEGLRVSVHAYNTAEEVDRFCAELAAVSPC